ncbi:MAG TPA: hypothetical protein VK399_11570, partial [Longimicrobiaceae bacterium]|nr:hypothetical protein [Longimicrobiaceae bacterium]
WDEAEGWHQKSFTILERLGNEHGAAIAGAQMAVVARDHGRLLDAGHRFIQAIQRFAAVNDPHMTRLATEEFRRTLALAAPQEARKMERLWQEAGLSALDENSAEQIDEH